MDNSSEIWEQIKQAVIDKGLVDSDELQKLDDRVETGRINSGDWLLAIENTLLKEERNA